MVHISDLYTHTREIFSQILGHFLVSVVTSTRSFRSTRSFISETRSSICPSVGFTVISGVKKAGGADYLLGGLGGMFLSKGPGVALTKIA